MTLCTKKKKKNACCKYCQYASTYLGISSDLRQDALCVLILCTPPPFDITCRGSASHRRLGEVWVPCSEIAAQFSCHTHFKISLEVPHPNQNIFRLNLDELEKCAWPEVMRGGKSPYGASTDGLVQLSRDCYMYHHRDTAYISH